jgi:hypothetical protein
MCGGQRLRWPAGSADVGPAAADEQSHAVPAGRPGPHQQRRRQQQQQQQQRQCRQGRQRPGRHSSSRSGDSDRGGGGGCGRHARYHCSGSSGLATPSHHRPNCGGAAPAAADTAGPAVAGEPDRVPAGGAAVPSGSRWGGVSGTRSSGPCPSVSGSASRSSRCTLSKLVAVPTEICNRNLPPRLLLQMRASPRRQPVNSQRPRTSLLRQLTLLPQQPPICSCWRQASATASMSMQLHG